MASGYQSSRLERNANIWTSQTIYRSRLINWFIINLEALLLNKMFFNIFSLLYSMIPLHLMKEQEHKEVHCRTISKIYLFSYTRDQMGTEFVLLDALCKEE